MKYGLFFRHFKRFHLRNPRVWRLFEHFTEQMIRKGRTRYSSTAVIQQIRWHVDFTTESDDEFKICNNYIAYYARMWKAVHPSRKKFYGVRVLKGVVDERELADVLRELADVVARVV